MCRGDGTEEPLSSVAAQEIYNSPSSLAKCLLNKYDALCHSDALGEGIRERVSCLGRPRLKVLQFFLKSVTLQSIPCEITRAWSLGPPAWNKHKDEIRV